MTRLLCTGGAGFIGRNFVRHVRHETDWSVTVLDSLTYAADPQLLADPELAGVRLVRGSVCDADLIDQLVSAHDLVIHFAAETHNDRSLSDPGAFVQTNVVGTYCVLEAVRRHGRRLHHVSTDEVFGDLGRGSTGRFDESSPLDPSSPYSATKAGSDLLVQAWVRSYGTEATISSSCNNFGPFQHVEKFIPRTITEILDGRPPRLYGTGGQVRDWIAVEDHCSAILAIARDGRAGERYLIGADLERSNLQIAEELLRLMDAEQLQIEFVTDRPGHDQRYATDSHRLRTELGWHPRHTDLGAALAQTVRWYRDHESWWRPAKRPTEDRYARSGQ